MQEVNFTAFIQKWLFRNGWVMALVFIFLNTWFKPVFNIVIVLFFAGMAWNGWLAEKEKLINRLFLEEPMPAKKEGPYIWGFFIELAVLLVGLHFLDKGFTTVTGMSERLFGRDYGHGLFAGLFSVSFIIALALISGMMLILYLISTHVNSRQLVLTYIVVDVLILMPFNFMFCYERNQKVNLGIFYTEAIPTLFDQLKPIMAQRKEVADNLYLVSINRQSAATSAADRQKTELSFIERQIDSISVTEPAPNENLSLRTRGLNRLINKVAKLRKQLQPDNQSIENDVGIRTKDDIANKNYGRLLKLEPIVTGLVNGTISTSSDSLGEVRGALLEICKGDSILQQDSILTYNINKLKVSIESPTDGFFTLFKDLFSWALKENVVKAAVKESEKEQITAAQQEWNARLSQKRWFSFLFSLLVDAFPLALALCLKYCRKQKMKHESR